jgi:hypothetical protein
MLAALQRRRTSFSIRQRAKPIPDSLGAQTPLISRSVPAHMRSPAMALQTLAVK